jgi:site-specific recombinase XerD
VENPSNPPSSPLPPPAATPSSLLGDLLEAARRRNHSGYSLLAYQRAWTRFLSWAAAADCDPRQLSGATALEAYAWLSEGKGPATIKQLRAALSFAFQHWDLKNPFAKIEPPIHNEPQINYLMLADVRRLLAHLRSQENHGYGARLAFHLANALFLTACRFDELIQLEWSSCQRAGEGAGGNMGGDGGSIVALRIKGKGAVFQDVPVTEALSQALGEWQKFQEHFKGRRIFGRLGVDLAASPLVFAGFSRQPFSNRAFNLRLRSACRKLQIPEITAHGLRHSAATILLNHVGKDLREIQELLRHKNIKTTVRYTHVAYEQTRETAEALSQGLG